jgi:hypothetical protein
MLGSSCVASQLAASQEGLSSMSEFHESYTVNTSAVLNLHMYENSDKPQFECDFFMALCMFMNTSKSEFELFH